MNRDWRTIRVFISSTFRDMQAERDYLVKFIFPQLRKLCESRGVTWGEVDLRWGVTDEQAAEGKVLPICLEEIKRCRPYFIGLLGERYGWVPQSIPAELLEKEEWLKEQFEGRKSVTELEILHGVLRDPKMAGHAYFYFRDPKYIDTIPTDKRSDFICEDARSADKLKVLKQRIRDNKFPVRENYPTPEALGELVLKDLTAVIDKLYPEGSQPDPLTREAMDHEAYAASRAQVYIGRENYYKRLDEHADGNSEQPLVILGESGSGKSALLANWVIRYRKQYPDAFIIQHYIGASPYSADWAAMLRRIMGEFKRNLHIEEDIPSKPDELRDAFKVWLYRAAAQKKIVLILDALNQLADADRAPDLPWLPSNTPANMRIFVSTLPGRPLDEISRRNWPVFTVVPLDAEERRKLIEEHLKLQARSLESRRIARIVNASQSANPLYLRVLLDELRVFGVYKKLDERIDYYLKAQNPFELYGKVITRWEEDYEGDTDLVGDTLSLLWAARRGLSESELLDALGSNGKPLPRAKWSPLYLAMSDSLVSRGGLLTFAHDFLRMGARDAYIPTNDGQRKIRLRLADYFEMKVIGLRQADELPWLLQQAGERDRLRTCLLDIDRFLLMKESNENELLGYWVWLGQERQMGKLYLESFGSWETTQSEDTSLSYATSELGLFLNNAAQYSEADLLMKRALDLEEASSGKDHPNVAAILHNIAGLYWDTNRLVEAVSLLKRAILIDEANFGKGHPYVASDLNSLAMLYRDTNRLVESEPLFKRSLEIDEANFGKDHPDVARDLNNLAGLYQVTNRLAEAEPLMKRVVEIFEKSLGKDHPNVATALNNLAQLYQETNRLAEAEPLMKRVVEIFEKSLGKDHPNVAAALSNLSGLYRVTNRLAEAEPLMKRVVEIFEKSLGKDHPNVATALNNLAQLYQETNRLAEAEPLMKRALAIDEASFGKDHPDVARDLNNLAQLYYVTNRLAEAEPLCKRALAIFEKSLGKDHPNVAKALNNLAQLYHAMNRLTEAEPLYKRVLVIFENSLGKDHPNVATALITLAALYYATNRLTEAEPLYKRALVVFEKSLGKDHHDVATTLIALAQLYRATNRLTEAEPLMKRALSIDEASFGKDHPNVARDLNNLAELYYVTNRLAEAEPLYKRALAIWEKSFGENHPNVARALNNLATLYQDMNRLSEAEPLYKQALAIDEASFGKDHPDVAINLNNMAMLYYATNRLSEADPLYKRAIAILFLFSRETGHTHPQLKTFVDNYTRLLIDMGFSQEQAIAKVNELGREFGISFGSRQ